LGDVGIVVDPVAAAGAAMSEAFPLGFVELAGQPPGQLFAVEPYTDESASVDHWHHWAPLGPEHLDTSGAYRLIGIEVEPFPAEPVSAELTKHRALSQ
jgi:hypothetical protein